MGRLMHRSAILETVKYPRSSLGRKRRQGITSRPFELPDFAIPATGSIQVECDRVDQSATARTGCHRHVPVELTLDPLRRRPQPSLIRWLL